MQKTGIAYADYSSNPIRFRRKDGGKMGWACTKNSAQCEKCYAERINLRFGTGLPYDAESMKLVEPVLVDKELDALERVKDAKVFIEDMSDLFGPFVPKEMRDNVLDVLVGNHRATFLLLTKWTGIMQRHISQRWGNGIGRIPDNLWVGATYTGDESVVNLCRTPAKTRWLSVEPMLSQVILQGDGEVGNPDAMVSRRYLKMNSGEGYIHWVIFGAESGIGRRPCNTEWIRDGVRQCQESEVKCFVKQIDLGHAVTDNPELFPADLRVREYPNGLSS